MQKETRTAQNREREEHIRSVMERTKINIYRQAGLTGMAIVVTLVLCFAMTVAWYSNIIHTGDMTFRASDWDFQFEGEVTLADVEEDGVVKAAPGDTGIVKLNISNDSDTTLGVIVNTLKDTLSEEMQKRIFFYADTAYTKNGENTERSYISGQDSYQYKVLAGNALTLNKEYCNDIPLKWEWVYDVLGYYVRGTIGAAEGGTIIVNVDDYIRPVVYDYDQAEFDDEGELETVDGVPVYDYLAGLYASDGYAGTEVGTPVEGYYPVEVDEYGHGVWLYLCSQAEIQAANEWDSSMATLEEKETFQVKIVLTGQKVNEQVVEVATKEQLAAELAAGTDRVVLPASLSLSADMTLEIPSGAETILDLNGNTLDTAKSSEMIKLNEGSRLTILNGTLKLNGGNDDVHAISMTGSILTMNHVILEGAEAGVLVDDSVGSGVNSKVHLIHCTMDVADVPLTVWGNGTVNTGKTTILVEKSTLNGRDYVGIMGNGSANKGGTDIQIMESNVSGKWAGIYQPQSNSTMIIKNSTISGYTGIAIKGGNVIVDNSQIFGIGESAEPGYSQSGWIDTGDAIYVEDNYGVDISVIVKGENTTIKSNNRYAFECFVPDSDHVSVSFSGGTFSSNSAFDGDIGKYTENGYISVPVADGSFKVELAPATE